MKRFFILSLLLSLSACNFLSALPITVSELFMSGMMQGEVNKAYKKLFEYKAEPVGLEQRKQFITGTFNFLRKNGKPKKYARIENRSYGGVIQKVQYLLQQERGNSIWTFYYVKGGAGWKLQDVKFTDQIALVL